MLDDQTGAEGGPAETKHDRFLRLAPPRVERALHALDIIAKLASPQNEYSQEEAGRLVEALRQRVDEIERLLMRKPVEKAKFSFS